ncbi:MAG: NADH-quinone oxidoreductase subunit A [Planctomycetes bacterium]|nr:NADH-quinone oxidoreductase subunit A [Planctomycetota bacterium]
MAAIMGMFLTSYLVAPKRPSAIKEIPYECGIEPEPYRWSQIQIRYYVFAILFLIFDVEAVFLFPWAIVFLDLKHVPAVFYEMLIFMGILFFKVASGLCVYFIASSLWGVSERKLLPKPKAKDEAAGSSAAPAKVATQSPTGNGAPSAKKKRQRGRK